MGLGKFAFEEEGDGVDAVASERGKGGEAELTEHAARGGTHNLLNAK